RFTAIRRAVDAAVFVAVLALAFLRVLTLTAIISGKRPGAGSAAGAKRRTAEIAWPGFHRDLDILCLFAAQHLQFEFVADLFSLQEFNEGVVSFDRFAIRRADDIAFLQAGLGSGAILRDLAQKRAAGEIIFAHDAHVGGGFLLRWRGTGRSHADL